MVAVQDRDVRLEDVAQPIKENMFSRTIDPATPGLVSSLKAQVLIAPPPSDPRVLR